MAKLSTLGIVTLVSVCLYAIIVTVLEILVIVNHHAFVANFTLDRKGKGISEADLIYHTIFILSLAFQVLLCIDALWRANSMQLISLVLFNLLSLVYSGVQLYQHKILEVEGTAHADFKMGGRFQTREDAQDYFIHRMRPLEYTIIGIVTLFSIYLAILSYRLMKEFGWEIYRTYSADVEIRDAFRSLSILQTLIKLDVFFIGSYAIQLIPSQAIGYHNTITETVLIFVVGTIMLLMAWYSIMNESKYLLLCVINILALSLVYMAYRIVIINIPKNDDPYEFTRRLLTFFLATTIALVLATIYSAIVCFRNLMRGVYIFSAYGLPGQQQQQQQKQQKQNNIPVPQMKFNSEYLGYNGHSGYGDYNIYSGYSGYGNYDENSGHNIHNVHNGAPSGYGNYGGDSGHNVHNIHNDAPGGYGNYGGNSGYNVHNVYNGAPSGAPSTPGAPGVLNVPDESAKPSKRASKMAEAERYRLSRRLSID